VDHRFNVGLRSQNLDAAMRNHHASVMGKENDQMQNDRLRMKVHRMMSAGSRNRKMPVCVQKPHGTAQSFLRDDNADAIVEATIIFPIMLLVFAALFLLSVFLPTRAALQRATQYAATALATEKSDTWLVFDEGSMSYRWETDKDRLQFVYVSMFSGIRDVQARGETIVSNIEEQGLSVKSGNLSIDCSVNNWVVYQEVAITASRVYDMPGFLSTIGFPDELSITVTSVAVVQNGDEFIRNIDLAVDFVEYIAEKFNLTGVSDAISKAWDKVMSVFNGSGS